MPLPPRGAGFTRFWGVGQAFFTPVRPLFAVFGPPVLVPGQGAAHDIAVSSIMPTTE